jgi:Fic family protein
MPLLPETHRSLLQVSLRKGALATTAIEGNTLTEEDVARIESGASLPPSKEYMEREVKNILDAYNSLLQEVAVDGKAELISPDLLRRFHEMIGRDLGDNFDAIPGRLAERPRFVLRYRAPEHQDVPELLDRLCEWLAREFRYSEKQQTFAEAVVQAIVTHVYIEWIHPFSDGNGRTGRLVEFYLLLRAGNPDIGSHILSNFYNETRSAYYRQLERAGQTGDLTKFIAYAVQGFRDGLMEVLEEIQADQFEMTWDRYVYEKFASIRLESRKRNVFVRQRMLALEMPHEDVSVAQMVRATPKLAEEYAGLSQKTVRRDVDMLLRLGLIRSKGKKYKRNYRALVHQVVRRRPLGTSTAIPIDPEPPSVV